MTQQKSKFFTASVKSHFILAACVALAACSPASTVNESSQQISTSSAALQFAAPEEVGMDSARLDRVTQTMQGYVDDGLLAGVVTMVARDNKIVHFESVGFRDIEAEATMTNDALFRIYSMTKPITGVAMMILYEEGKFRLSDPVEKYIPEFANLQVAAGEDADGNLITEPQNHKMTIRELMSHSGGLSYGLFSQSKVDDMYNEVNVLDPDSNLQDMIDKLAALPLRQQPGSMWHYSVSVDVQGYLVEKLSGQGFGEFLEERIFEPLGMTDTDFYVPEEKASRFAQVYGYAPNGDLVAQEAFGGTNDYLVDQEFESGGGGLVSSTMDYMRFAQMVLNGGILDGERILAPLTVDIMHRNQLPKSVAGIGLGARGTTFGLDFAIIEDPVEAESYSKGEFYWGGAAGTWFWIDPVENLVFVGMIQQFGGAVPVPDVRGSSRRMVYQAIMVPK
ncbi:MAG: serine hydrolase [SAR86 cluster bacterium]|uniref:Serine hydrolase n=1 Tax=SAR86 cluster bacterium TaxID=2030880 RepID=A0A2A5AFN9_9GAMM|nr:MAG: serine hydrolase [SAR86 cluster bacterium]